MFQVALPETVEFCFIIKFEAVKTVILRATSFSGIEVLKQLLIFSLLLLMMSTQIVSQNMEYKSINTTIGKIAVYQKEVKGTIPVIFLHGVYYEHKLWSYQTSRISERTIITLDMPLHGQSKDIIKADWTLNDCANMLIEVLDSLGIKKVIAIGHSWGSMTILRAAKKAPERFQSIGLCNMPFEAATKKTKRKFKMQHFFLPFRSFYAKQVAKALYGKRTLESNPELLEYLESSMNKLNNKEIKQTDKSVIINADNGEPIIRSLKVPAIALKGREDYVPESKYLLTQVVDGGHVSPLEAPQDVYTFVMQVIKMK